MATAFASIASRAIPVFRTIWSFIKSSPTLTSVKDAVIAQVIRKGTEMLDEKIENRNNKVLTSLWEITKEKASKDPQIPSTIKKHIMRKKPTGISFDDFLSILTICILIAQLAQAIMTHKTIQESISENDRENKNHSHAT